MEDKIVKENDMLIWEIIKKYQEGELKEGDCIECLAVPENDSLRFLYIKDTFNKKIDGLHLAGEINVKYVHELDIGWAATHNDKFRIVEKVKK